METEEFYYALIIYGGLLLGGGLVVVVLGMWALKLRSEHKKKSLIKELYGEKERKNGQSKGGSHGHY